MLFTDINLIEPLQKAIVKSGYVNATPIQSQAIPTILEGKDLLGIAQTGTGKTAAFTLPILQLMYNQKKTSNSARTLILAPTRELAAQIGESILEYGSFTRFRQTVIFGGVKQYSQEKALAKGVDIIIATPGRLLDLIEQGFVNLNTIEFFILDEADRMLDMGFINDIKKIIAKLPKKRQSLFFSATMSPTILELSKKLLTNPVKVEVTPQATTIEKIDQGVYFVDSENKNNLLLNIVKSKSTTSALVFTRTKHKANKVAEFLSKNNIRAEAIHGNKSQAHRVKALDNFKSGGIKALVATEIVARGIDVEKISHVINYELPNEPESYVHRIGRTARAGNEGIAYSFCSADERNYLTDIEALIKKSIPVVKHEKHSDFAQNAKGKDAKPIARGGLGNFKPTGKKSSTENTKKFGTNKSNSDKTKNSSSKNNDKSKYKSKNSNSNKKSFKSKKY